jgi:excisionase family DNA binding protein
MQQTQTTLEIPNPEAWMSVEQAISTLGVSRSTVYEMIERGTLGNYRVGKLRLLWRREVTETAAALALIRGDRK